MPKISQSSPSGSCAGTGRIRVIREGRKHVVMSDGPRFLTIPRSDPVNAHTMGGIVAEAGLSAEAFKALL